MAKRSSLPGKLVSVMCAVSLCAAFSFPCEALGKSGEVGAEPAGAGSVSSEPDIKQQLETSDVEAEPIESAKSEVGSSLSGSPDASSMQAIDLYTVDGVSAASDNSLFEASIEPQGIQHMRSLWFRLRPSFFLRELRIPCLFGRL